MVHKSSVKIARKPVDKTDKEKSKKTTAKNAAKQRQKNQIPQMAARLQTQPSAKSKKELILALLRRNGGACLEEMMAATGWQAHSVRGFLSGTVKNTLGLKLTSQKRDGADRRYHVGKQS